LFHLGNALKFTLKGYIEIIIKLHGPEVLEFIVKDTGIGIKPEILPLLAKPYKTFDTEEGLNKQGIGLGLIICK